MITLQNITKSFGDIKALDNVSVNIKDSSIYGLIGSNGAGKSTLLKILCGAYRQDGGEIFINDVPVYDNYGIKKDIVYLSDDQYFLPNSTIKEMSAFYSAVYETFDFTFFNSLLEVLKLDPKRKINTFSKGMQKQTSILLGLSSRPKFLFCDETFDGLDPVMRQYVKKLLASDTADYSTTTIIASHNLRELEDICDHVGILHRGGILLERDLDDLKLDINNFQCAFGGDYIPTREDFPGLDIVTYKTIGSVVKMTVRGDKDKIFSIINQKKPILAETLPLTLEEIFIEEMEGTGYDLGNVTK
ncbi:MAG: ABC transporter ATP-binding protein [Oscillospiraceae bacterium]|nr:ABC transporter ATP-binding protein [Oscillospiraceae bacterium]